MDGNGFIALAGKLAAAPAADEATCRTAISRAYYGAFHVARSFLQDLGFRPFRNANVHAFVAQCLIGSGQANARIAGLGLSDLQAARNHADYDLEDTRIASRDFAMKCVEQAHGCRVESATDHEHALSSGAVLLPPPFVADMLKQWTIET